LNLPEKNKSILLIDGNNIAYRSFYAIPGLTTSTSVPTNAVYGFLSMLLRIKKQGNPKYLAICFDAKEKTFRALDFDLYKAQRKPMPDPLIVQMKIIKEEVLLPLGIPYFERPGFEADDCIATLAKHFQALQIPVSILSGDRDMLQLVKEGEIEVLSPLSGGKETKVYTEKEVYLEYGIHPIQMIDYKAIVGDPSDNIRGATGIGPKTAQKLLEKFGSIELLLADTTRETEKLRKQADTILLNQKLICLHPHVPIETTADSLLSRPLDPGILTTIIQKFELKSLLKRVEFPAIQKEEIIKPVENSPLDWKWILNQPKIAIGLGQGEDVHLFDGKAQYSFSISKASLFSGDQNRENFLRLLESKSIQKILFEGKKLLHAIKPSPSFQWTEIYDLQLFWYLWKPNANRYEESLFRDEFGDNQPFPQILWDSFSVLWEELENVNLLELYRKVEYPLLLVLYKMEVCGIQVSRTALGTLQQKIGTAIVSLQQEINTLAGTTTNVLSPKQVSFLLFEKLELPAQKKTKTGYSTESDVLAGLTDLHPVVTKIMLFKELSKIQNTYVDSYLKLSTGDGKLHTTYLLAGAATGRISSITPNLQNIPMDEHWGKEVRKVIVPRAGNSLFVSADYSQIDLRVMAHFSGDPQLVSAFLANEDIHQKTARILFHLQERDTLEPWMRNVAKTVNFGVLYGMTSHGLSESLKISEKEAKHFIETYFSTYSGVTEWIQKIIREATQTGYVSTILGRRRPIPELQSTNKMVVQWGHRLAVNTIIQGTSADIIKKAMLTIDPKLDSVHSLMVLQIHDELVFEVPDAYLENSKKMIKEEMEQAISLSVPLEVHLFSGKTLADLK
jgi:DNA polymerase-1